MTTLHLTHRPSSARPNVNDLQNPGRSSRYTSKRLSTSTPIDDFTGHPVLIRSITGKVSGLYRFPPGQVVLEGFYRYIYCVTYNLSLPLKIHIVFFIFRPAYINEK